MKVIDYVSFLAEVMPRDALVVSSHTDNSVALAMTGLTDRSLLGFNMGFATSVGLGLALALPHRRVFILDGDGGVLLSPSSFIDLAAHSPSNVITIVADNGVSLGHLIHTSNGRTNIEAMVRGAGIEHTATVQSLDEFKAVYEKAIGRNGLTYIVAKTEKERVRPPKGKETPFLWENKYAFVRHIERTEDISIMKPFGA